MKESHPKRVKLAIEQPVGFRWIARYATIALGADSVFLEALWYSLDLGYRAQRATEEHVACFVKPELERVGLAQDPHIGLGPSEHSNECLQVALCDSAPLTNGLAVAFWIEADECDLRFVLRTSKGTVKWPSYQSGQWKAALTHFLFCFKEISALVEQIESAGLRCHYHDLPVTHLCRETVQLNLSWNTSGFHGLAFFGTPSRTALCLEVRSGPGSHGDWTAIECSLLAESGIFRSEAYSAPDWHSDLKGPVELQNIFPILCTYTQNLIQVHKQGPIEFIRSALLRNSGTN